jgi:formylmethanofuran dehydrogenase subunit D
MIICGSRARGEYTHAMACICMSENDFQKSVLSLAVGSGDPTQVMSLFSSLSPTEQSLQPRNRVFTEVQTIKVAFT